MNPIELLEEERRRQLAAQGGGNYPLAPYPELNDDEFGEQVKFFKLPNGQVVSAPPTSAIPDKMPAFPFPFPGPPRPRSATRPWEAALPAEGSMAVPARRDEDLSDLFPPAVAERGTHAPPPNPLAGITTGPNLPDPTSPEGFKIWQQRQQRRQEPQVRPAGTTTGPINPAGFGGGGNGYTYGFGGTSPGAEERIARALATVQPGSTPGGLTASQKKQLSVPVKQSNLEKALGDLAGLGVEGKMARGLRDYKEVGDGSDYSIGGSRTRAIQNPDGSVTMIGGNRFGQATLMNDLKGKREEVSESRQAHRRLAGVDERITRKNKMEQKLETNRGIKIAENELKKNPASAIGEPKTAAQAGIKAVQEYVAAHPANKFNQKGKEAVYSTGVSEFQANKQMANDLKNSELVSKGYENKDQRALASQIIGAAVTNADGTLKTGSALQQALANLPGVLAQSGGLMTGNVPANIPPISNEISMTPQDALTAKEELATAYPTIFSAIEGKSPEKAMEHIEDEYEGDPPENLKRLVKQYKEAGKSTKEVKEANVPAFSEQYEKEWYQPQPEPIRLKNGKLVTLPSGRASTGGNAKNIPRTISPFLDFSPQRLVDKILGRD